MLPETVSALIVPQGLVSGTIAALREVGWHQHRGVVRKLSELRAVEMNELAVRAFREGDNLPSIVQALLSQGAQVHLRAATESHEQAPDQPLRLLPLKPTCELSACNEQFEPFTFIELFSGIGGFRVALDHLGGKCLFSCDKDESARATYRANFGDESWPDILTARAADIPPHDILTGGFPCQPFSVIGKQQGFMDPRGTLFREVVRVLCSHKPKAFLLENVPGLVTMEGGSYLRTILKELSAAGYIVGFKVLDARGVVPQVRCRVFLVGIRSDLSEAVGRFGFPVVPALGRTVGEILEPEPDPGLSLSAALWAKIEASSYYQQHPARKLVDVDGCAATLIRNYKKTASFCQFVRQKDQLPRLFSPRECARLQGFPEDFILPSSDPSDHDEGSVGESKGAQSTSQGPRTAYKLLGNAVPPPVVALVAAALLCSLQHACNPATSGRHHALRLCGLASPGGHQHRFTLSDVASSQPELPATELSCSSASFSSCSSPLPSSTFANILSSPGHEPGNGRELFAMITKAVSYDAVLQQYQAELRVANPWIGRVIGKGGITIADIRRRCAPARIFFPKALARTTTQLEDNKSSCDRIRHIYISSPTQDSCTRALEEVLQCLVPSRTSPSPELTVEQLGDAFVLHVHPLNDQMRDIL